MNSKAFASPLEKVESLPPERRDAQAAVRRGERRNSSFSTVQISLLDPVPCPSVFANPWPRGFVFPTSKSLASLVPWI